MKAKCVVVLILMCVVSMLMAENVKPLKVVYQDSKQLSLKLTVPTIDYRSVEGSKFTGLEMEGAEYTAEAGYPELPMYSTLVAIPATGSFEIKVRESNVSTKRNVLVKPVFTTPEEESAKSFDAKAYTSTQVYPALSYTNSSAQVMRDFRVVQISLYPVKYNAAGQELKVAGEISVDITFNDKPGENEMPQYSGYSYAFRNIYESMISNFSQYRDVMMAPASPRILLIYGNNTATEFQNKLAEFVTWKRQKGFEVNAISTATIGSTSNTGIKNYIQSQYNNLSTRPDFVILLGDTNGSYPIPAWTESMSSYGGEGDYPYTHLAGSDLLGDVFLGRISASNYSELDVILNKGYTLEKNVNTNPTSAAWLNKMLLIGDPSSSGISTQYVNRFIKELAMDFNPDYTFIENYSGGFSSTMNSGISQGVGFFNYRGYISMSGWSPSSSLMNGVKLPHATIITCSTGSYANSTSTTESLIRLGTSAVPAGSVTAIGMATSGTHTMFNNCLNAGIYDGIFSHGMRTMGEALLNGKLYIKSIYASTHDNQANYFSHWCNLMGDPTVEVFTGIPKTLSLVAPSSVPLGTNVVDMQVVDGFGVGVSNVTVTAYSNSLQAVIGKGFTNEEGVVTINLSGGLQTEVTITASAHDCKPVQQILGADNAGSLVYFGKTITDNNTQGSIGNGDSFANAGERIALSLEIKNTTSSTINNITATVSCDDPYITINSAQTSFGTLVPGQTMVATLPFLLDIANSIPPEHDVRLSVALQDEQGGSGTIVFHIATYNARLVVNNYIAQAGNDAILDPGETGSLQVWVKNSSISAVFDINAELISLNDLLEVTDATSYIGAISGSMVGVTVDGFQVHARNQLIAGMQMPMRLRLFNDQGFEQFTNFNISIGQVFSYTPLGPDEYGYFIYDVTDVAYSDCPTYDWIEITPALGGSGTQLTGLNDAGTPDDEGDQNNAVSLKVLDLPFPFTFYGVSYNQITVCVNGFITMGVTANGEFRNYHLPGGYGPSPMIAAFWDDLILISDAGIYQWYDAANHRYIIQYNKMRNGYNRTSLETFQVIFYDPMHYPTSLGDGMIKIQYKDFNNVDVGGDGYSPRHGNYSSIGIKDHTNTRGLEYTYNNIYAHAAAPLAANKALLITTLPVLHESANLSMSNLTVNDDNGNGIAEPNENVILEVELSNSGLSAAQNVTLQASTNSPYATFIVSESSYNTIEPDASASNNVPLQLLISQDCPNEAVIPVSFHVTASSGSWDFNNSITVRKPTIDVNGIYVNDMNGNNNGVVDANETVEVIVNVSNTSNLVAHNVQAVLSGSATQVSIGNPNVLMDSIAPLSIMQVVYHVTTSPSLVNGTSINLSVAYSGDLIPLQNEPITIGIGASGMNDTFETDNGSYIPAPLTNGWEWGVSSEGAHSGTKVWGTVLNGSYPSNANFNLTTPSYQIGNNLALEFWHKYSAESTYDGGQVKISVNNSPNWVLLTPVGGYPSESVSALQGPGYDGNSDGWVQALFDLSAYANQSVRFRFVFMSDGMIEGPGWFIDDVKTTGFVESLARISGTVSSSNPNMNYGSVRINNTQKWSTIPNNDGTYALYLPYGTHQLSTYAPGYTTSSIPGLVLSQAVQSITQNIVLGYLAPSANLSYIQNNAHVYLSWSAPETPEFVVSNYSVYRKIDDGDYDLCATVNETTYNEAFGLSGTYSYYVITNYPQGSSVPSNEVNVQYTVANEDDITPQITKTELMNNFPNPFNPQTTFRFSLKDNSHAKLCVYNLKGQLVKTLVDSDIPAGMHSIVWNGKDDNNNSVASGIYLYRLVTPTYNHTRRAIMMK